jgi:hypothetical protein
MACLRAARLTELALAGLQEKERGGMGGKTFPTTTPPLSIIAPFGKVGGVWGRARALAKDSSASLAEHSMLDIHCLVRSSRMAVMDLAWWSGRGLACHNRTMAHPCQRLGSHLVTTANHFSTRRCLRSMHNRHSYISGFSPHRYTMGWRMYIWHSRGYGTGRAFV